MLYPSHRMGRRGFTLVEMVVTAALFALIFGGLFASVQFSLKLLSLSKASTGASSLANERLEYIRSLAYDTIGTVSGIPSGPVPQNSTTTLNGVLYHERVLIGYVDSPDDGVGGADVNGILADYKQVKVEYTWLGTNGSSSLALISNIVPPGIESTAGGGTLTVNVFDANVQPVLNAQVRVYNDTTTTTIDTTRSTNASGTAMFAGAPAAANYQITVTKAGYSSDQTYSATTSNPSPITSHVAVLAGAVSTMNFQIDQVSSLRVRTVGPATTGLFSDSFTDASQVESSSQVVVGGGDVVLTQVAGVYDISGSLRSVSTTPSVFNAWDSASWNASTTASTSVSVQVYSVSGTSTYVLIPDADLPGNSVGFTASPLDISGINAGVYPALSLGATLSTSDVSQTPTLHDWRIDYIVNEPPVGTIPFTLTSTKIIGSTPVYKYEQNHTTSATGTVKVSNLEWDSYKVTLNTAGYNISQACPEIPYALEPAVSDTLTLTVVPSVAFSLRVHVVDPSGNPIVGATVDASRPGYSDSGTTSTCGQIFFNSGLVSASDYAVLVQAPGYTDQTVSGINVSGSDTIKVIMAP